MTIQREKGGKFKKGVSANPNGRPRKDYDLVEICKGHTQLAIEALVEMVKNKDHKDRRAAAEAILDRAWGKPRQQVEHKGDGLTAPFILDVVVKDRADRETPGVSVTSETGSSLPQ